LEYLTNRVEVRDASPRVGNLMAHLRSNITVRVKRTAWSGPGRTALPG
jgi:hypothetical protein